MGLGFLGSSAANPGWKYPLYNIKIEKEELLADCGATEKHGCGVSKNSLEAISGRCDVCVSRILFLESVSSEQFRLNKRRAFRGHSKGIRGHSGSSKGIRFFFCSAWA